jgi:eukaryotic-like serine/threonine-protein kinase
VACSAASNPYHRPDTVNEPLTPGARIAGHQLLRKLGSGSHGTVYLAEPPHSAEQNGPQRRVVVALKVVPLAEGDDGAGFLRQARAAQALRHPGIVTVHTCGVEGTWAWLAMEPVPGTDLQRYTQPNRLLPEALVLTVGAALAQALAYAHAQGVVHRDIKPANVLVHWPAQIVKLADFGLARSARSENTQTGVLLGTPVYMAPEHLAGAVPTPRSDTYALGVTLFQLLTGRLPHQGASMGALLQELAANDAPLLLSLRPGLPPGLSELLARLLARSPTQRPNDLQALGEQLSALAEQLSVRSGGAAGTTPTRADKA